MTVPEVSLGLTSEYHVVGPSYPFWVVPVDGRTPPGDG